MHRGNHHSAFPDNADTGWVFSPSRGGVPTALARVRARPYAPVRHHLWKLAPDGYVKEAQNAVPAELERLDVLQQLLDELPEAFKWVDDVDAQTVEEGK